VVLFDKTFPDQPTNKPVCTDCHGVHDIVKVDDPSKGLAVKENLLARCQKCHPDASANFPDAWLSHYIPTPEKYPIVYYVNLFYKFLIPGVLVPMAVLAVMDFTRKMINRFQKPKPVTVPETPPPTVEETKPVAEDVPEKVVDEESATEDVPEKMVDEEPSVMSEESKKNTEEAQND
jgi:hypothetical protein